MVKCSTSLLLLGNVLRNGVLQAEKLFVYVKQSCFLCFVLESVDADSDGSILLGMGSIEPTYFYLNH